MHVNHWNNLVLRQLVSHDLKKYLQHMRYLRDRENMQPEIKTHFIASQKLILLEYFFLCLKAFCPKHGSNKTANRVERECVRKTNILNIFWNNLSVVEMFLLQKNHW